MLKLDREGHIVNTASIAGMTTFYFNAPYHVTKCAVVAHGNNFIFLSLYKTVK
jgi:NADP-dependent 3-hydroxy acid dehydrogenase YdfG